jgi:tetratricopeptide (TPR) repeat protein
LQRFDEASLCLRELLDEAPAAAIYNNLGIIRLRRATPDPGGATYYFNQAAEADPTEPDYRFNLGYAYALGHDLKAALYWLRQTVRLNPGDGMAHLLLGLALKAAGSEVEAARERELAARLAEDDVPGRDDAGGVPHGLERAQEDLEGSRTRRVDMAVIASEQRDEREVAAYHLEQGRRLFESERDREAIVELKRCLYLSPYQHEANLLLGRIYLRGGLVREAIEALTISIWSQETVAAQVALGEALHHGKDDPGARRAAARALELDPSSTAARQLLQKLDALP